LALEQVRSLFNNEPEQIEFQKWFSTIETDLPLMALRAMLCIVLKGESGGLT
jgi:hypothetical protein